MKTKLIAYYLPQFHPIKDNDKWWGKGFTEWTNVAKAKPLFKNHKQPLLPGELGFYDLRVPEVRQAQSNLALKYGIQSFCYWHYWFGNGKRIMELPINEVLKTGQPEIEFCFAWANKEWGGLPYGDGFDRILQEQIYPGMKDHEDHFYALLPAFLDKRYTKIEGKPIFQINLALNIPNLNDFFDLWNNLALKNGLPGIYFIAHSFPEFDFKKYNYNGLNFITPYHLFKKYPNTLLDKIMKKDTQWTKDLLTRYFKLPRLYDYKKLIDANHYNYFNKDENIFPVAIPNWDHSPRSKFKADIIVGNTPELFIENLNMCYELIKDNSTEKKIIFIKSWNEWAEGNILEPDCYNGKAYLEAIKKFLIKT